MVGLLYVANRTKRPFSDHDEATLLRLADEAAVAIRNAQLFESERESERRYRTLVESSIQGLHIQRDWVTLFANPAFARMLGYDSTDELVGLDTRRWIDAARARAARERPRGAASRRSGAVAVRIAGDPARRLADLGRDPGHRDRLGGRAGHPVDRARHQRAQACGTGAPAERSSAPPGSEDGSRGPARRRRRARLQQPPDRHHRAHGAPAAAPGGRRSSPARRGAGAKDRRSRGGPHAAAARVQPQADAPAARARPERRRRGNGPDAQAADRRDDRAGHGRSIRSSAA